MIHEEHFFTITSLSRSATLSTLQTKNAIRACGRPVPMGNPSLFGVCGPSCRRPRHQNGGTGRAGSRRSSAGAALGRAVIRGRRAVTTWPLLSQHDRCCCHNSAGYRTAAADVCRKCSHCGCNTYLIATCRQCLSASQGAPGNLIPPLRSH